ncbi:MAG: oligosaccharide flippase family protein [Sedimentisphaerales bacterium]|nr:oligosaccharide flippase family protein [Sedimentisphaerales bacterium]
MLKTIFNDSILKRMFKNASILFSGKTIAGLMGLVSLSLAARALGAEKLGIFAMIQAFIIIVDRLTNFQSWQALIKFGADFLKQDKKEEFKSLVKFCFILDAATAVIGTIVAIIIVIIVGNWKGWQQETVVVATVFSFWILFNLKGTAIGLLRLYDKFRLIAAANVTAASLKLFLAICAYMLSGDIMSFVIIWLIAGIIESVFLLWAGWHQVNKKSGGDFLKAKLNLTAKDKNIWKFVLSTNLNQSVRLASKEADVLIVGTVLGLQATGIYKIAKQFASILAELIEPAYQAIYPELAHLAAEKRFLDLRHVAAKTAIIIGSLSMLVWLVFIFAGKWILAVAAGKEYIQAYGTMVIFVFAFAIWGFSFPLPAGLLAIGRAEKILLVQVIVRIVYLASLYLLLVTVGLIGAGIAQVILFVGYSLLMSLFFVKDISAAECSFSR